MIDMLVRLYRLPSVESQNTLQAELTAQGIILRPARAYERHIVADWVGQHFSPKWVSETKIAFSRQPIGCFIATREKQILGFACCDVTARGYIGPMGVDESQRGTGLGKALLLMALESLKAQGYAYAIVGGVGPAEFYARAVGATPIEDSTPALYEDILPDPPAR